MIDYIRHKSGAKIEIEPPQWRQQKGNQNKQTNRSRSVHTRHTTRQHQRADDRVSAHAVDPHDGEHKSDDDDGGARDGDPVPSLGDTDFVLDSIRSPSPSPSSRLLVITGSHTAIERACEMIATEIAARRPHVFEDTATDGADDTDQNQRRSDARRSKAKYPNKQANRLNTLYTKGDGRERRH